MDIRSHNRDAHHYARDAHVIVPAQPKLMRPDFGLEHAEVALLDNVDATVKTGEAGDFLKGELKRAHALGK